MSRLGKLTFLVSSQTMHKAQKKQGVETKAKELAVDRLQRYLGGAERFPWLIPN
jgi:hypothetical protein